MAIFGGLDDWTAPAPPARPAGQSASAMRIDPQDGGLDDWMAPAQNGAPPAAGLPTNAANTSLSNRPLSSPDPFAAHWAMVPASRIDPMAWDPPSYPNSVGQSPSALAPPPF